MSDTVLVTGGTGFVGARCVLQLLEKGYNVKTSMRSLERKNEAIKMLNSAASLHSTILSLLKQT